MYLLNGNLEFIETPGFRQRDFCCKVAAMVLIDSLMMPSDAAKKARKWEKKCCSVGKSLFQSAVSAVRSISSVVQKDA